MTFLSVTLRPRRDLPLSLRSVEMLDQGQESGEPRRYVALWMGRGQQLVVVRRRCRFLFGLLSGYLQHQRKGRAALLARELGILPHGFANERDNLLSVQGSEFFIDCVHAAAPFRRADPPTHAVSPLRVFKSP
jgi:hypothetical protein